MYLYSYYSKFIYGGIEIGDKKIDECLCLEIEKNKDIHNIVIKKTARGLAIHYKERQYQLVFPKDKWDAFPSKLKDFFTQEFGFISTATMPLIAEINTVAYNTPKPLFENQVKEIILHQIPGIADDYGLETLETMERFRNIQYSFGTESIADAEAIDTDGAVVLLSCGKDSLLTLGFARELDLDVRPIHINDTTTPYENSVSLQTVKKIQKQLDIHIDVVTNNIEKLNDFETWDKEPTCLGYSHMITGFCFLALPFLHNTGSMVLLGNQQNMNFSFQTKQNFIGYPSYDQTTDARHQQEKKLQHLNGNYRVLSLIEPLTDIAEMKILFSRYPELAKYEFSCNCLYDTNQKRWCHSCNKCARLSLFLLAHGFDLKTVELMPMLSRRFMKYYALFGLNPEVDRYEKSIQARDQQLLGFYLAYRNGTKGDLIDVFKKRFLSEAIAREDELRKTFFKIYKTDLPGNLKTKLHSIIKEELKDLQ